MTKHVRVVAMVVALAAVTAACGNGDPAKPPAGGSVVFGAQEQFSGFSYGTSKGAGLTAKNVAENIYFYAAKSTPEFGLDFIGLEKAPTVVSTNPQVVEWVIKSSAVWSDKTPITSRDIEYYFNQVTNKANDVDLTGAYSQITKFEVTGEKTFRATFNPTYSDYATLWEAVPQAAYMQAQPGGWNTGRDESPGPSGGPYMVGNWDKAAATLTLVRNPEWWGEKKPGLDSIVFRFLGSPEALRQAVVSKEIDMATPQASIDLLSQARSLPGVRVEVGASADWEHITFNTQSPMLRDPLVRRAVAHAIDRNAVVDVAVRPIAASATPMANFVFLPGQPGWKANDGAYAKPDRTAATRLLQQAGWARGASGWTKEGQTLELTLSTTPDPVRREQMDLMAFQLREIGIATNREDCDLRCVRMFRTPTRTIDIAGFGFTSGVSGVSAIKAIYQSDSPRNFGKWANARFDDLMKQAVAETDPQRQATIANEADRILWEELPALPLYQKPTVLIVRDDVVGPRPNGSGDGVFYNSHEWSVKTGK